MRKPEKLYTITHCDRGQYKLTAMWKDGEEYRFWRTVERIPFSKPDGIPSMVVYRNWFRAYINLWAFRHSWWYDRENLEHNE